MLPLSGFEPPDESTVRGPVFEMLRSFEDSEGSTLILPAWETAALGSGEDVPVSVFDGAEREEAVLCSSSAAFSWRAELHMFCLQLSDPEQPGCQEYQELWDR